MTTIPLPTTYEYATLGSCQKAVLKRAVFSASGSAILLLFDNGDYTAFQASDIDEGRQLTNLQPHELLLHFYAGQLVKCGLCERAALEVWQREHNELVESERREARYYMYTRLKQEFEEGCETMQPFIE